VDHLTDEDGYVPAVLRRTRKEVMADLFAVHAGSLLNPD
jgi:hypothetical protein